MKADRKTETAGRGAATPNATGGIIENPTAEMRTPMNGTIAGHSDRWDFARLHAYLNEVGLTRLSLDAADQLLDIASRDYPNPTAREQAVLNEADRLDRFTRIRALGVDPEKYPYLDDNDETRALNFQTTFSRSVDLQNGECAELSTERTQYADGKCIHLGFVETPSSPLTADTLRHLAASISEMADLIDGGQSS